MDLQLLAYDAVEFMEEWRDIYIKLRDLYGKDEAMKILKFFVSLEEVV